MLNKIRSKLKSKDGSILVFALFFMLVLVGFTGLVVDGGIAYAQKIDLQKAANAAALSGAQLIIYDEDEAEDMAIEILEAHGVDLNLVDINITSNRLDVTITGTTETYFIRLFGRDSVDIAASASAGLASTSAASGVASVGIHKDIELVYGQSYTLKWDEANVVNGWFGALRIDGNGANVFGDTIKYGSDSKLKIGDIVDIENGNMAGKAKQAVNYLIGLCEDESFEECVENRCERIILAPVYEEASTNGNNLTSVRIVGFSYFYIDEATNNNKSIVGRFVEGMSAGTSDINADSYGVYTVRLI